MNDLSNPTDQSQQEIIEAFSMLPDWTDRYQYIIDLGRNLPPFPEAARIDANKLHGCQSQVWMVAERRGDRMYYQATSDSAIVSGLIALLLKVYSGRRPDEILATQPDFIRKLELHEHLSPTRSNGLNAMIGHIRRFAAAALAQS
jgi:cysteine desulfuration protein SufE